MNLLKNIKITRMYNGSTAASADVDSTVLVDMAGYEGCMFIASAYKSTAGGTTGAIQMVGRHSAVNTSTTGITDLGTTSYVTITGFTTAKQGRALVLDIYRPTKRYVGVTVNRAGAGNLGLSSVYAIQYGTHNVAVTQTTGNVLSSKTLVSPTT